MATSSKKATPPNPLSTRLSLWGTLHIQTAIKVPEEGRTEWKAHDTGFPFRILFSCSGHFIQCVSQAPLTLVSLQSFCYENGQFLPSKERELRRARWLYLWVVTTFEWQTNFVLFGLVIPEMTLTTGKKTIVFPHQLLPMRLCQGADCWKARGWWRIGAVVPPCLLWRQHSHADFLALAASVCLQYPALQSPLLLTDVHRQRRKPHTVLLPHSNLPSLLYSVLPFASGSLTSDQWYSLYLLEIVGNAGTLSFFFFFLSFIYVSFCFVFRLFGFFFPCFYFF